MKVANSALLLGAVFAICEGGILPIRQAPCSPVTLWNYMTVTQTVIPPTVTILQQDPNSIASSAASVDTAQVSIESIENPVSAQPYPETTTFIHSIYVSGYEATEVPNPGASVFYLSKGPGNTNPTYTPSASIFAEVTTVTVKPVPAVTSAQQQAQYNTTNGTFNPSFSSPSAGWNGTLSGSSTVGVTASSAVSYGPPQPTQPVYTATVTAVATVFATTVVSVTASDGYDASSPSNEALDKRQTCVWISATIGGQEVGWCNNWAGGSTLTFTSWETTTTPSYIPGIGPITKPGTTSTDSAGGSVTIQTSTNWASTPPPAATPSACGQTGPFQIGFDDLPVFSTTDNNTADFPPIFNPYEHFFWGNGWTYVPPPTEPFPPQSGNRLAQFIPSLNNTVDGSPDAGSIPPSSFGAGPRNYDNNYWFSASSAYVGCDNGSRNLSQICDFVATAYQWDNITQTEVVVATQHFRIPPCPDFTKCQLTEIDFNYLFYKMSTLSFYANVQGQVSQFWIDSIDMNWYNNTCAAGLARLQSRKYGSDKRGPQIFFLPLLPHHPERGMSSTYDQPDSLNGHSGLLLAVFCVVSVLVIWPVKIALPASLQRLLLSTLLTTRVIGRRDFEALSNRRLHIHLSLTTAPVLAVILLLATTTLHGSTIRLGIVGDETVKPYDVLVLFISLAYISIALDGTGALEATAFYVSKRGGSSGRLLFTYLYAFFLLTACIVGNDPLILSGTPFLAYLSQHTDLDPTAWVFAEFMAANTASAVLVSSNPTNILITGSFGLNYLTDFTKWTVLPSLIPAVLNYPILLGMFWQQIPKTLTPLTDDPWSKLRDRAGAFFLSALMLVTVSVLVGTSFVPGHAVQVWMVTAPAGVSAFLFNVVHDWFHPEIGREIVRQQSRDSAAEMSEIDHRRSRPIQVHVPQEDQRHGPSDLKDGLLRSPKGSESVSPSPPIPGKDEGNATQTDHDTLPPESRPRPPPLPLSAKGLPSSKPNTKGDHTSLVSLLRALSSRFPSTAHTISLLPIQLLPFAMAEFILVRGLSQRGWIRVFAIGFARACTSPAATVFFFGFVSAAFLCPLAGTNIGATIILVEILRDPQFTRSTTVQRDPRVLLGAIYSVAMGSNIGAFSYTFAGSLAGLLWRGLLAHKGVRVSQWKFARVNMLPLLMQIAVSSAIVLGEVYWFA
ncbi:hypothetical protein AYL99_06234 [Fonsecaea erecta]|uniref:Citrate transporter-like domain-containing protein n=1 Tax=Fonsecaea erecta TaxID=1367422 RepID=A0A178ZGL1_9EURO|nr:hypothetical protein AYL99_06234 [Fonsecaea erecta]OAP58937.1 hypothetical protein AYL99_06234 [Fonsecaea erecta]